MSRRVDGEPAYALRVAPYRETSALLEIYTAEHGRVGLVARGARSAKSRLRGVLQPFTPLLLSWIEGGELGTLQSAEASGPPLALGGERVFLGWYLNELLLKLLARRDPHPELFPSYVQTLTLLPGEGAEAALRGFEMHLLQAIGYGLLLDDDLDPAGFYRYDPERGPQPLAAAEPAGYTGDSLIALRDARLRTPLQLRDARRLLRAAIDRQLGGRELESRRLLQEMRARRAQTPPGSL